MKAAPDLISTSLYEIQRKEEKAYNTLSSEIDRDINYILTIGKVIYSKEIKRMACKMIINDILSKNSITYMDAEMKDYIERLGEPDKKKVVKKDDAQPYIPIEEKSSIPGEDSERLASVRLRLETPMGFIEGDARPSEDRNGRSELNGTDNNLKPINEENKLEIDYDVYFPSKNLSIGSPLHRTQRPSEGTERELIERVVDTQLAPPIGRASLVKGGICPKYTVAIPELNPTFLISEQQKTRRIQEEIDKYFVTGREIGDYSNSDKIFELRKGG